MLQTHLKTHIGRFPEAILEERWWNKNWHNWIVSRPPPHSQRRYALFRSVFTTHAHTSQLAHRAWSLTVKGFKFHNYSTCHHQFTRWNIKRVSAGNRRVSVIKWRNNPSIVSTPLGPLLALIFRVLFLRLRSQLYKERGLNSCQVNQPINSIKSNSVCLKQRFDPGL